MGALSVHARHEHVQHVDSTSALLSIPPELRNQIYHLLFTPPVYRPLTADYAVQYPSLADFGKDPLPYQERRPPTQKAALVRACRQIHHEANLLYLSTTPFHLIGAVADPVAFANLTSHLPADHRQAIRHIVLTARISHLRNLNETWNALPFGHSDFFLETLTLVPCRPETHLSAYAEVADLSQCHTLAYILAETLKGLRNVGVVSVRNEGCFNELIWRLAYRSLVFRLWKWGGRLLDLKFREDTKEQCFEVLCTITKKEDGTEGWKDVQTELTRLIGTDQDAIDGPQ
ncbi:2-methylcitrate synthase, mitochondrial [Sphaceloma murrayae]|uniref:2-methylcitrate synthase, mitochondrial n=1 Tax=Sphaceloma murrayae TaxID=2082308 RepID=A0A2K1R157_9PEZI|nr:2-methylcitrate synthase, mitochondrial [Sphaceloma murrayae]